MTDAERLLRTAGTLSATGAAALQYAERGWPVLPLYSIRRGVCACGVDGCKNAGKHPIGALVPHGLKSASWDPERIHDWWRRWPDANVGVVTGPPSGLVVLDVDPRHGGADSLSRLIERYGGIPETLSSRTGGGGMHYLYRYDADDQAPRVKSVANAFGVDLPGLDLKASGGYVVAPPSLHASGKRYTWEDEAASIAPAPAFFARQSLSSRGARLAVGAHEPNGARSVIHEGKRNAALTSFAGLLRARGMDPDEIAAASLAHNAQWCDPPLDEAEVRQIAASVSRYPSPTTTAQRPPSAAARLIAVCDAVELFHTPEGDAFAAIAVQNGDGTHRETWALGSRFFKSWLRGAYYHEHGSVANSQALQDALATLEGRALHEGPQRTVRLRVADRNESGGVGGALYLDLGNASWQTVEISATGWRVLDASDAPVYFRRARSMRALPVPVHGGGVDELRAYVNVASDHDWRLMVSWLVAALRPRGPYPLLILQGEQGTAKSTTARALRALIDPSQAPLRTLPRDERDLMIAASNSWALAFDNLSGLSPWMADALCRLATGGGFATRELFSDASEVVFDAMRPIILNGIDEIATRQDLADRALIITLPQITEMRRRSERAFWGEYDAAAPRVLGALLDALSAALANETTTSLPTLPRMADFAIWATAAEPGLRWPAGAFLLAYAGNQAEAVEVSLEGDPVATAVRALLDREGSWSGTATDLLGKLEAEADERTRRSRSWPKSARGVSNHLRRVATFLRRVGVEVEHRREHQRRVITLSQAGASAQPCGASVTSAAGVRASAPEGEPSALIEFAGDEGASQRAPVASQVLSQAAAVGMVASSLEDSSEPPRDADDAGVAGEPGQSGIPSALTALATRPSPLLSPELSQPLQARVEQLVARGLGEGRAIRIALIERGALPHAAEGKGSGPAV